MIDDALGKNTEYFVYTLSGLRTRSEMLAAHTHCISKLPLYTPSLLPLRFINWYLSIWDVAFISSDDDWSVLRQIHLQLLDPLGDFTPRFEVSDIIHN